MKIAILDDYQGVALQSADWSRLTASGAEITVFRDTITGHDALAERLAPFDVLAVMRERTPLPGSLLGALPNLRLIVTTGARNLSIDLAAAAARGITVCGTESRGTTTSEMAMLLILALSRGLVREANAMAAGGWQVGLGRDLSGLRLGLVGLGRLGAQVAALARPFGMEISAWSQNLTAARCAEVGVEHAPSLRDLLSGSDVVSIHLVLSERSRGLIGPTELGWMKPDALLVNTSRGPIADSRAVIAALEAGRLGGAAIDVYDAEPVPAADPIRDRELIEAGRLLLTPHIGYVSRQTWEIFYGQTVEAIEAWAAGSPVRVLQP
ncbi:D-2-hydroxyacid dehydrogenase family protein [Limibaculum sp. M0105]|uniref:D-2-hydroxyacid dehydrogenase family protein n=1 Tax=Thermohalobaculum xanthum TaxID=2753746 RepID=A0A8J7MAG7_9RHOB|nr:D-2-hydroxyacid dehydrogenase family protein [Thermohalobaculum xanthum]MBK0401260.1 D-2-hydroxyacid dehydrogenase family protein [Thermohalobaculum xanthum]